MCLIILKLKNCCVLNMLCDFMCWTLWWHYKLDNFVCWIKRLNLVQSSHCFCNGHAAYLPLELTKFPWAKTYVFLLIKPLLVKATVGNPMDRTSAFHWLFKPPPKLLYLDISTKYKNPPWNIPCHSVTKQYAPHKHTV